METYRHAGLAIWFEQFTVTPQIAVGNLGTIPPNAFLGDAVAAIETARWRSQNGETLEAFKARIRADLAAENITGVLVSIYSSGSFWERNFSVLQPIKLQ